MFNQLPENPKLISFSDSRDRAARLSMNVANRHREEVIAEAIFTRAKDYLENEPRLVREVSNGNLGPFQGRIGEFVARYDDPSLRRVPKVT